MGIIEEFFKKAKRVDIERIFQIDLRFGVITSVKEDENFCIVEINGVDNPKEAYFLHPMAGGGNPNDPKPFTAWGHYAPVTEQTCCIVLSLLGKNYILCTLPPLNHTIKNTFEEFRTVQKLNVNRLPIKDEEKRNDPHTASNEDLLKKGEHLIRSMGMADIFLDFIGNIVNDTSKQFSIRIGERDENNKITTVDAEFSFGNLVDGSGELLKDENDNEVKCLIKINETSGGTTTTKAIFRVSKDGFITFGNENADFTMESSGQVTIVNHEGAEIYMGSNGEVVASAADGKDLTVKGEKVIVNASQVNLGSSPNAYVVTTSAPGTTLTSKEGIPMKSSSSIKSKL